MKKIFALSLIIFISLSSVFLNGCKRKINPQLTDAFVSASYKGDLEQVKKLYAEGADVNAESKANYGNTPLMTSANSGQIEVVKFLLKHGAEINKKNSSNFNALGSALTGGRVEVVKLLLMEKADVNDIAGYGKTHLQRVLEWDRDYPKNTHWKELAEILKKAGGR